MNHMGSDLVGWAATAVFVASYFFARPSRLRAAQMLGSLLWLSYGLLIHSSPVIVANVLVFGAAAGTAYRSSRAERSAQASIRAKG